MEPISQQQAFNNALFTIRGRGYTPAIHGARCQYRSPIGPCAIGASIPDELYRPEFDQDTSDFRTIISESRQLEALFTNLREARTHLMLEYGEGTFTEQPRTAPLGVALQWTHDALRSVESYSWLDQAHFFERSMQLIAEAWGLEYAAPV